MTRLLEHDLTGPDHALVGFVTRRWYKATVNESETITDAKPLGEGLPEAAHPPLERS